MELGLSTESQTEKFPALSPTLLLGKEKGAKAASYPENKTVSKRRSLDFPTDPPLSTWGGYSHLKR